MQSKASTVAQYLAALPAERRAALSAVRKVILANLDDDYQEGMGYGMIAYCVPHRVFPAGYHCDPKLPLPFACLASQKNHMSLHFMALYGDDAETRWLQERFQAAGKKLDMGKGCIRFKKLEDLPLDVIGEAFARVPAKKYVEKYTRALQAIKERPTKGPPAKKTSTKKAASQKAKKR